MLPRARAGGGGGDLGRLLGVSLPAAAAAYGRAVEAGARVAAARTSLERIDAELAGTTRRLRALERRRIPAHEDALAALALELDEAEREDALRGRWFAERRSGQTAGRAEPSGGDYARTSAGAP